MSVTITDRRTIIDEADSTTGWTGVGYGTTTTDIAEATAAVAESLASTSGVTYFTLGTAIDLSHDLVYVYAFNNALQPGWQSGPVALLLGDGTNQIAFHMAGSDRRVFNHLEGPTSWQCLVLDGDEAGVMASAGDITAIAGSFASLDLSNITEVGCSFITQSKALGGGYNVAVDIMRYGRDGIRITGGTASDPGLFSEIAVADRSTANQAAHGVLRALASIAFGVQGPLTFGDHGAATDSVFEDSGIVLVFEDRNIADDKYYLAVEGNSGATNIFDLRNSTITTAGPFVELDFLSGDVDELTLIGVSFVQLGGAIWFSNLADGVYHLVQGCAFQGCGAIALGQVDFLNNVVEGCGQLTAQGGVMTGLDLSGYEGATDSSALVYNEATDPDGYLDNSSFAKGSAATHAIEFGTSSPTTMTLRGIDFTGYNASDGQNDSTLYVARTSGSVTINLVGCSGNISVKTAGASVDLVINPVTLTITVEDISTGLPIEGARVYVTADAGGSMSEGEVIIDGVTDVNGQISDTQTYTSDQPITGRVRSASSSPYYKTAPIVGTVDSANGLSLTIQMIRDE